MAPNATSSRPRHSRRSSCSRTYPRSTAPAPPLPPPASPTACGLQKTVPAFSGPRHGAGHTATVDHPGGGEYANVASNWLLWQFKNDKKAAAMFVGDKCELCTNSNRDVRAKGYKDARNEGPSGTFDRGSNQQAWQNANYKMTLSQCKNPP